MRRIVSVWLPRLATDRLCRARPGPEPERPLVLAAREGAALVVRAVNAAAARAGLAPGLPLADARALVPGLQVRPADAEADARALRGLADWATRYTPHAAPEGTDGLFLDISGCAHLFGGEAALIEGLTARLGRLGYGARAAVAGTPGAAWAMAHLRAARYGRQARFGPAHGLPPIVPPGGIAEALAPLPVAALRLDAGTAAGLRRLGIARIGELSALPRAALGQRFGPAVLTRLDQALGRAPEPISPQPPAPGRRALLAFAEPIARAEDLSVALDRLLADLCRRLEAEGAGARRLELALYRVDGGVARLSVGTGRPMREPAHLKRLFAERLTGIDPGFGIEAMVLAASAIDSLPPRQIGLEGGEGGEPESLSRLLDRLCNRLGPASVVGFRPRASHIPERAVEAVPPLAPPSDIAWPHPERRPVRLLPCPEPVEAVAGLPNGPPALFCWRGIAHRVRRAEGPERIAPEWWREPVGTPARDYYRIEDEEGRRFWLYRAGPRGAEAAPRWYLHGLFA